MHGPTPPMGGGLQQIHDPLSIVRRIRHNPVPFGIDDEVHELQRHWPDPYRAFVGALRHVTSAIPAVDLEIDRPENPHVSDTRHGHNPARFHRIQSESGNHRFRQGQVRLSGTDQRFGDLEFPDVRFGDLTEMQAVKIVDIRDDRFDCDSRDRSPGGMVLFYPLPPTPPGR